MPAEFPSPSRVLFVGLGSPHGDDSVGWLVAAELQRRGIAGLDVRQALAPLDLLDWLEPAHWLLACDGCRGLGVPGAWRRWTWPDLEADLLQAMGTHDFGVPGVLELASRLGRLARPPQIWGIEVGTCEPNEGPRAVVSQAVTQVADDIVTCLAGFREDRGCTKPRSFVHC